MAYLIYSLIPYTIWLGADVFRYNKNLKKGKDTFQINQLVNIMFSSGSMAFDSGNADFSKDMIATMIGLNAIVYSVYWITCLFVKSKYDRSFMSK